jgi:hypothetical protein
MVVGSLGKIVIGIIMISTAIGALAVASQWATRKEGPLTEQPSVPAAPASQESIDKVLAFYKNDPKACPQVTIDAAAAAEFPQIREVLAVLKYVLQQDDFELGPTTAKFNTQPPPYQLDMDYEQRRRLFRMRLLLDDPKLMFRHNPPEISYEMSAKLIGDKKSTGAAQTYSGNEILLTPYAGGASPAGPGDPKYGWPWKHPFRLGHTILHELVHVDQVRSEGQSPNHGNKKKETPPYAWEHSFPAELKSLFHPATIAKFAKLCEGTSTGAIIAPSTTSQRVQATTAPSCDTPIAAAVKGVASSMPFYAQSKQSKAEITAPLRWGYDGAPIDGASSASVGTPRQVTFTGTWQVRATCNPPRTQQQMAQAYQDAREPCGKTESRRVVTANAYGPNSCAWSSVDPGTNDPNVSGDPYMGGAGAFIATSCGDITVYAGVGVFAPASHGARNKPDALTATRADAEKHAKDIATKLLAAVNQSCGRTPS